MEIDKLDRLRSFGNSNQNPKYKRNFYGFGCTSVYKIFNCEEAYSLKFTPDYPINISHCDIYDDKTSLVISGEAMDARINYRKEQFIKIWSAHEDSHSLRKSDIQSPE